MKKRNNFTLVELLVSLGVFSILLLVFMQLFNSMRQGIEKTEKQVENRYSATVAMDIFSKLLNSIVLVEVDEGSAKKPFPFYLTRSAAKSDSPCSLYFATKARGAFFIGGSSSVKFAGLLYPHSDNTMDLPNNKLHKIYLVSISNAAADASGKNISAANRDLYHKFWPAPDFDGYDDAGQAREGLETELKKKVKLTSSDTTGEPPVVLVDNVTEFKVKLYDANGGEVEKDTEKVSTLPDSLEITISILEQKDFEVWNTLSGTEKETFQRERQQTFSRRFYIGDRVTRGGDYDKY